MRLTRRAVGGLAATGLASLAGCSVLNGPVTFDAEAAVAAQGTLDDTGYELEGQNEPTMTRKYAGKEVKVTNVVTEYQKTMEVNLLGNAKLGVFVAFSTPSVKVAGQGPFNPIKNWSNKEIVMKLQSRYDSLNNVKSESSTSVKTLGKSTDVGKFSATTTYNGEQVDLYIHITKVQHEDDFVVLLGMYPQQRSEEEDDIMSLMKSVKHPA